MLDIFGPAAASFFLSLLATVALRPVAVELELLDRPGGRKMHQGDIPTIGGLAMMLGLVLGVALIPVPIVDGPSFLAACAILVAVGLIDDRFQLSPWTRLGAQSAAAILLMLGSTTTISGFGGAFAADVTLEGNASYVFTLVTMVAAMNAFNMIDGIDGVAGALAVVALGAMALLAQQGGPSIAVPLAFVALGSISAFLLANIPLAFNRKVRCFMGDGGSTMLGVTVVWVAMLVSQGPQKAAPPVTVLWAVALPLYDLMWSVLRRLLKGRSPLEGDAEHFHHLLLAAGLGVRSVFVVLVSLAALLAAIGITSNWIGVPDSWSFLLLILCGVLVVRLMYHPNVIQQLLPKTARTFRLTP